MESTSSFVIVGMKRWKGTVDGSSVDSAKLYAEVHLDDTRNDMNPGQWARGKAAEELKVTGELVERVRHVPLPFVCDVTTKRVSNGKQSREVVIDIRPREAIVNSDGVLDLAGKSKARA